MKKYLPVILIMFFSVYISACGKKQAAMEEMQEPMSLEALTAPQASPEAPSLELTQAAPSSAVKLEPLPPVGSFKPTASEIQTALKNANFYTGPVDGKIGPVTKKAIEEFQKANNLKADGKAGPKTWEALSKYLAPMPAPSKPKKR